MQIGSIFILLALLATIFSGWKYYSIIKQNNDHKKAKRKKKKTAQPQDFALARMGFTAMTILVTLAAGLLMYLILTHHFEYDYIYRYSSRDLALGYLISSFWAGQEGSFLLWALLIALMGMVFFRRAGEFEPHSMVVVNLAQGFFLLILLKASPFALLPQTPIDGAGLNPLLQDPWMVIHPPILFLGYAAAVFPFALAVAALLRREHSGFISQALPWTLIASLTLGAGIIIGGYWAYNVLGWGGYWGWDPVENSSLVPWLTIMALFHGLIVQKIKGSLVRTNFVLAILSFILVLYATFLTRSGVLADFSVHSFQDLGINLYLIVFMGTFLALGFGAYFKQQKSFPRVPIDFSSLNRENILLGSLYVFLVSAVLTSIGTSAPIFTGLVGDPSQPGTPYYNNVHLPIGIVMGLLLGVAPFLRWKEEGWADLLKSIALPLVLTALSVALTVYAGLTAPLFLMFAAAAAFALWSNVVITLRMMRVGWQSIGAPLSHVGVALLLIGIIISGQLEQKQRAVLNKGVPVPVFDYQMTYQGTTPMPNGKDILNIEVADDNSSHLAQPRFYYSEYNRSTMGEPGIKAGLFTDLYISPLEKKQQPAAHSGGDTQIMIIKKGEKQALGEYQVYFKAYSMGNMGGHAEGQAMQVGAALEISKGDETYELTPRIIFEPTGRRSEVGTFPVEKGDAESEVTVHLHRVNADEKTVELVFTGLEGLPQPPANAATERVLVDVSQKPFMNVLWLGTILILAGTAIALKRRYSLLESGQQLSQNGKFSIAPKPSPEKQEA